MAMIIARAGDNTFFWTSVVLVNILLFKALKTSLKKEVKAAVDDDEDEEPGLVVDQSSNKSVPAAATIPRAKPKAGSPLEEVSKRSESRSEATS